MFELETKSKSWITHALQTIRKLKWYMGTEYTTVGNTHLIASFWLFITHLPSSGHSISGVRAKISEHIFTPRRGVEPRFWAWGDGAGGPDRGNQSGWKEPWNEGGRGEEFRSCDRGESELRIISWQGRMPIKLGSNLLSWLVNCKLIACSELSRNASLYP